MARPQISEFSFGYAVTEALTEGVSMNAAPVFPSLIQEGQAGGGWDVQLSYAVGFIAFLQFKLCDEMKTRAAHEIRDGHFLGPPVYRMHIRPGRLSKQHQMLLDLEDSGEAVYYVAPRFSSEGEFNNAYLARTILSRSVFVSPSDIGVLDDGAHHLAFDQSALDFVLFSKPRHLHRDSRVGESFMERTREKRRRLTRENFEETAQTLQRVAEARRPHAAVVGRDERFEARDPQQRIGFLSRVVFGVEPVLIVERSGE